MWSRSEQERMACCHICVEKAETGQLTCLDLSCVTDWSHADVTPDRPLQAPPSAAAATPPAPPPAWASLGADAWRNRVQSHYRSLSCLFLLKPDSVCRAGMACLSDLRQSLRTTPFSFGRCSDFQFELENRKFQQEQKHFIPVNWIESILVSVHFYWLLKKKETHQTADFILYLFILSDENGIHSCLHRQMEHLLILKAGFC